METRRRGASSQSLEPDLQLRPVDVLVVVDTSNSMAAAIDAMEASINDDFAAILGASGIPYQVIGEDPCSRSTRSRGPARASPRRSTSRAG